MARGLQRGVGIGGGAERGVRWWARCRCGSTPAAGAWFARSQQPGLGSVALLFSQSSSAQVVPVRGENQNLEAP